MTEPDEAEIETRIRRAMEPLVDRPEALRVRPVAGLHSLTNWIREVIDQAEGRRYAARVPNPAAAGPLGIVRSEEIAIASYAARAGFGPPILASGEDGTLVMPFLDEVHRWTGADVAAQIDGGPLIDTVGPICGARCGTIRPWMSRRWAVPTQTWSSRQRPTSVRWTSFSLGRPTGLRPRWQRISSRPVSHPGSSRPEDPGEAPRAWSRLRHIATCMSLFNRTTRRALARANWRETCPRSIERETRYLRSMRAEGRDLLVRRESGWIRGDR